MNKIHALLIAIPLLFGCAPVETIQEIEAGVDSRVDRSIIETNSDYVEMDDGEYMRFARESIAQAMRDPDSVRLSNERLVSNGEIRYYCARINAKNGFGGYTGERRIVWANEHKHIESRLGADANHHMMRQCG